MLRWIWAVITLVPRILFDYTFYIKKYAKKPNKYSFEVRYRKISKLINKVCKRLRIEFIYSGLENLKGDDKKLIIGNHLSSFDPLCCLALMNLNATFVGKIEVSKLPIVPKVVEAIEGLLMDRSNLKQSLKVMMHIQQDLEKQIKNWVIYPEGTRNHDELALLQNFHPGTFRSATKAKVSIIPFVNYGTQRVLKVKPCFKKFPVHISFLKPIKYEDYKDLSTDDIAKRCKDDIQRELSFNIRRKDHEYNLKKNKKKYIFNRLAE